VSTGLISLPSAHGNGSSSLALLPLPSLRSATGPASHRATAHAALASSLSLRSLTRGTRPSGPSSTSGQRRKCRVVARASQPRCHHLAPTMRQGSRRSFPDSTPPLLPPLSLSLLTAPPSTCGSELTSSYHHG
jgi:uncharacterized membrane protein